MRTKKEAESIAAKLLQELGSDWKAQWYKPYWDIGVGWTFFLVRKHLKIQVSKPKDKLEFWCSIRNLNYYNGSIHTEFWTGTAGSIKKSIQKALKKAQEDLLELQEGVSSIQEMQSSVQEIADRITNL